MFESTTLRVSPAVKRNIRDTDSDATDPVLVDVLARNGPGIVPKNCSTARLSVDRGPEPIVR
jgi:hypothetical protein